MAGAVETDHRRAWQLFANNFYLFQGTPTGIWLTDELVDVFGVTDKLNAENAQTIYDQIDEQLKSAEFQPRNLYMIVLNIEVLCTTDAATDTLTHHQAIRDSGWHGRILPTFSSLMPLSISNTENWRNQITTLSHVSGINVVDYASFIQAIEQRRAFSGNGC